MSDLESQRQITEVAGMGDSREDDLLTEAEAAERMRVALVTLRRWRRAGTGPQSRRLGRQYRYRRSDIEQWIERSPTAGGAGFNTVENQAGPLSRQDNTSNTFNTDAGAPGVERAGE